MELTLHRKEFTDKSTIGELFINNVFECFILEDVDRGLISTMTLDEVKKIKVFAKTCIPYGRNKIIITKSERFSKMAGHDVYLPLLLNVLGFDGTRMHPGNKPEDTEACLLPGTTKGVDLVGNSRTAFIQLNEKINNALKKGEDVWINIIK